MTEAINTANSKTTELNNYGKLAKFLPERERMEAAICFEKLKAIGASMTEATDYYIKRHPSGGMRRTISQVIKEMILLKRTHGNLKPGYVSNLERALNRFVEDSHDKPIHTITVNDIEAMLGKHSNWSPCSVHGQVQSLKVLFYFAMRRGYAMENPCLKLQMPVIEDREPVIASVADVRRALENRKQGLFDATSWLAIGFFAGLRASEISELQWEQVDFENKTVTVLTAFAKGRARRIIDMSPNLVAWLSLVAQKTGPVIPAPVAALRKQMCGAMGWSRWPQNVMRKSFASYHMGLHRNEALLKIFMGHGDDGRILHNHYRALVQPNAAKEFWNIFP